MGGAADPGGELFAIDGCKLPSNAANEWSEILEQRRKEMDHADYGWFCKA
jgi:hypothetical protein